VRVAYIAGSYRAKTVHGIVENIRNAEAVAIKYWKLGYAVICPHKNTALLDGVLPDEVWLAGAIELLKRSDIIVMSKGWERSTGSVAEHKLAKELGMEIIYE